MIDWSNLSVTMGMNIAFSVLITSIFPDIVGFCLSVASAITIFGIFSKER